MGKLQIEDRRQQEEVGEDLKKEESPLALPPPHQVQGESSQDLPKDWKFVINHPQDQIIGNPSSGIQSCPKESHLSAVKRILRYLKGTMDIGLWASHLADFLLSSRVRACVSVFPPLRAFRCVCIPLFSFVSFISAFLMAPRRESAASKAQGKRPTEPSQPDQSEARRKTRYNIALFGSVEDYQRYKQKFAQRKVVPGRNINFSQLQYFGFEGIFGRMGWLPVVTISEPIFPTLIRAFYSRVTYGLGGPITSTVREVEIILSPESICRILAIPSVGLRVYESKVWPTVSGFKPIEAIQRMCGLVDA
ncbi:hypothetical protein CK203_046079 [Vitis vinifera]|uniref:Mitochondrial protein n=1 Tax=Vitis vinifera TaxID=29760 RepID=A0A438HP66_VITVI|nr:hypothetical protein CK203_046079 [Vitis vinifera]